MNRRNNDLDDFDDLLDEIGAGGNPSSNAAAAQSFTYSNRAGTNMSYIR